MHVDQCTVPYRKLKGKYIWLQVTCIVWNMVAFTTLNISIFYWFGVFKILESFSYALMASNNMNF
jgi:hypothetical protein